MSAVCRVHEGCLVDFRKTTTTRTGKTITAPNGKTFPIHNRDGK